MQNNLLNINNINAPREFSLEIQGIEESQPQIQEKPKTISPLKTGLLFGTTRIAGDILAMSTLNEVKSLEAHLMRTFVMHFLGKATVYGYTKPQIAESNNLITANIKAFACENFGAVCGFLAKEGINYVSQYQAKLNQNETKLISDFILLATWFASGKFFVNNCNKMITEREFMKKIEESGFSKFKNVKKSSVFFFIDVLASTLAATASIYANPMGNAQNIGETTVNAMACGTTFAVVQQTTRALLQKAYNTVICERGR